MNLERLSAVVGRCWLMNDFDCLSKLYGDAVGGRRSLWVMVGRLSVVV